MSSVFSTIIAGELPARFLWKDETCVVFLSVDPVRYGHALVVPVQEVDQWTDVDPETAAHLMQVAQRIGQAQRQVFEAERAVVAIAGFEVPHTHIHVWAADSMADFTFTTLSDPDPEQMDQAAFDLRAALRDAGSKDPVPAE